MTVSALTRATPQARVEPLEFTGPGSWTAAEVAGYLATGTPPALMRQVMARWPHPGDYEAAARTGGPTFTQTWPVPVEPLAGPPGSWMALFGTPDYPAALTETQAPPLVLFGVGNLEAIARPGLAVVGTRQVSAYGEAVATTAVQASPPDTTIVSGLAAGVDATAHTQALKAARPTVAVLPTGPDQVYPAEHARLAEAICAAGGALVSEHPFGTGPRTAPGRTPAPLPARLVARNRIIAGLCGALVLAEATGASGSMHTVWSTLLMGRPLLVALPKGHARQLPGAQAPLALAHDQSRTRAQLLAMGAPAPVADRYAGVAPLASAVALDRDELAVLTRTSVLLTRS